MIYFYSGTPGSGKSLRVARDILIKLRVKKQNVISNMEINYAYIRADHFKSFVNRVFNKQIFKKPYKKVGKFFYIDNIKLTPNFLYKYAAKYHKKGVEGQTLLVLDEAQLIFSPTVVKIKCQEDKNYRNDWLKFFTQHRKLGYNIVLISQFDRLIDPQLRCLFEYNCIHRKVNNFGIGSILSLFKISVFVSVHYWYGAGANARIGSEFYTYSKKYSRIYDSYKFHEVVEKK